jgi:hypothetical protein
MILRFDGVTGTPAPSPGNNGGTFVAADSGGLNAPVLMTFTETDPTTLAYAETETRSFATCSGTMATSQAIASPASKSGVPRAALLVAGLEGAAGSAVGPDGALYVTEGGASYVAHPPTTDFEVRTGVQYVLKPYRGGFLVTDGHHNRVLRVTLGQAGTSFLRGT